MAYAFVQEAHNVTFPATGQPVLTMASNVTKGNLLIAWLTSSTSTNHVISDFINSNPAGVDGGVEQLGWIPIKFQQPGGYGVISAWYCIARRNAPLSVQFFDSSTTNSGGLVGVPANLLFPACQILEFSGDSLLPLDASTFTLGNSTTLASTVTAAFANELVIGIGIGASGSTVSAGAGWTSASGGNFSAVYNVESLSGSYTPGLVQSPSGLWGALSISFLPATAGFTISGSLGSSGAGATVIVVSQTTGYMTSYTADGAGNYTTVGLPADSYTVTPQKAGFVFSPAVSSVILGSGITLTPLHSDTFQRPDENPLSDGGKWTAPSGLNTGQLVSHAVESITTGLPNPNAFWTGDGAWANDQYSQITVQNISGTGQVFAAVRSNVAASATEYYVQTNVGAVQIYKEVAGSFTQLTSVTVAITAGDKLALAVIGTTLYALKNGAVISSVVDNSIASGTPGFMLYVPSGSITDAQISAWEGGTPSSGSNVTGLNFTPSALNTNIIFTTLAADTMQRANESPLSNGGMWVGDGSPIPPFDPQLQLLNNEGTLGPLGTVNTSGTAVTWVSGLQFSSSIVAGSATVKPGMTMYINNASYSIASYNSATSVTLATSAGVQTGVQYNLIIPTYAGPWSIAAISENTGTPLPNDMWAEVQIDALNSAPLSWAQAGPGIRINAAFSGYLAETSNNGDGTFSILVQAFDSSGLVFPPKAGNAVSFKAWVPNLPCALGDKIRLACVGTNFYLLHNGSLIATFADSNSASGNAILWMTGQQVTDVGISHFLGGSANLEYTISGNAGVAGATVSWTGVSSGNVTADGSGNYTTGLLTNGTYTITPTSAGYMFSPTSLSETVSNSNITGANFTASHNAPTGQAKTINQVQFPKLYLEGFSGDVADVDSSGHLLTGGSIGTDTLHMGPRSVICGPSRYATDVDTNANLLTTNG